MPIIHIEMLEGRSLEQKENLIKEVSEVVSKNTDAPLERITVIITEIKPENLGQNGKSRR